MQNGLPRILIIRLSAIGDVVRVLPALHGLRDRYPQAQIDWVVEPKSADILEDHPALDNVLLFHRQSGIQGARAFTALMNEVRSRRYDIVLDFHGILKSSLLVGASGAKRKIGFAAPRSQEGSHLLLNERVALPSLRMNRIEENLLLVRRLEASVNRLDVAVHLPDEVLDQVDEWWEESFSGAKWVVLMHAPVERPEKQWPLPHFAALVDKLLADGRFEVALTWGPGQLEIVERLAHMCHRKPVLSPELPSLRHFAALCQKADLFMGCDTGPMHIASAMGTPVVAVFGGTDPAKHAPLRVPSVVLHAEEAEWRKAPRLEQVQGWLSSVTPASVYDACVRLLHEGADVPRGTFAGVSDE